MRRVHFGRARAIGTTSRLHVRLVRCQRVRDGAPVSVGSVRRLTQSLAAPSSQVNRVLMPHSTQYTNRPIVRHGGAAATLDETINVVSSAHPYLTLDPSQVDANGAAGVSVLAGYIADGAGAVLPLFGEIMYSPLYVQPR